MPKRKNRRPVCSRFGKVIYGSFMDAMQGAGFVAGTFGTARVYFDKECQHWHVTKQENRRT